MSLTNPFVHAKAMIVDGKAAYVGSINLTAVSITQNREVGVILTQATEVKRLVDTMNADFAKGKPL